MTGTLTVDAPADSATVTAPVAPVDADTKMRELIGRLAKFNTKEEIAKFFLDEGVRGTRQDDKDCPIAKWLAVETGARWSVGKIAVMPAGRRCPDPSDLGTPKVVEEFIDAFDLGEFPELATGVKTVKCDCPLCGVGALAWWNNPPTALNNA